MIRSAVYWTFFCQRKSRSSLFHFNVEGVIMRSNSFIITEVTDTFFRDFDRNKYTSFREVCQKLFDATIAEIRDLENSVRSKDDKLTVPKDLSAYQVAQALLHVYDFRCVFFAENSDDPTTSLLVLYDKEQGIYINRPSLIRQMIQSVACLFSSRDISLTMDLLRDNAPLVPPCRDPNLIAVGNGIFNYETKELMPFSPDYVFLAKSPINYVPGAKNPVIHDDSDNTDWDVESWFLSLSDDPEIIDLLWKITGAVLRPHVRWNKSAWFYSERGNNGKGTFCAMLRNLAGPQNCSSIPISDFGKDFALEPLLHSLAIIVDENSVGEYIDKSAAMKAVITGDVVSINRKYMNPISFSFSGFMIQCLNEYPKVRDRSSSWYRRQLFVPFEKCFTGIEKPYIKSDFLKRNDVLEYVLCKVLNTNYDTLPVPKISQEILIDYMEFNDPVTQFWSDIRTLLQWDIVPFPFLWDLYRAWFAQTNPSGKIQGRNRFILDMVAVLDLDPDWACPDKKKSYHTKNIVTKPEPLIDHYNLTNWKNRSYSGNDIAKICTPNLSDLAATYHGIIRV